MLAKITGFKVHQLESAPVSVSYQGLQPNLKPRSNYIAPSLKPIQAYIQPPASSHHKHIHTYTGTHEEAVCVCLVELTEAGPSGRSDGRRFRWSLGGQSSPRG